MLNLGCRQYLRNPFFPGFWGQKWGCGLFILADYTRLYTVNILFSRTKGQWPWDLVCSIGDVVSTRFAQMMNLAWPTLWQGQIWFLMHLYGEILKCSFFYNCLSWNHNTFKKCLTLWDNGLYKYQMSSWPVTFYPMPLIWTAICHQNGCNPHIWLNKIYFIISCIWPWPILTLLKRSGERLRTFRSSSFEYLIICFWLRNKKQIFNYVLYLEAWLNM